MILAVVLFAGQLESVHDTRVCPRGRDVQPSQKDRALQVSACPQTRKHVLVLSSACNCLRTNHDLVAAGTSGMQDMTLMIRK